MTRTRIRVSASIKQAGENPYEKALRRYSVGNRYVGTVSMVDMNGVFVSLDGGIDCLCSYPSAGARQRLSRNGTDSGYQQRIQSNLGRDHTHRYPRDDWSEQKMTRRLNNYVITI